MPYFIKTGLWEKTHKGFKGWLNINDLFRPRTPDREFTGEVDLSNAPGTIYPDYSQTGALTLSVKSDPAAITGGSAFVTITANGSAITVPSDWLFIGGDAISTATGDKNHLGVFCMGPDKIHYGNTVES